MTSPGTGEEEVSAGPLAGILVLDLSRVLAGPLCTQRLADLGARVIKIETPDGDPTRRYGPPFSSGESAYFLAYNRGKESMGLDLAKPVGREVCRRILERADVLVENFRPGALERLGFDDAALRTARPDLVHLKISGYGIEGADAGRAAFDLAVQAESGLMAMTGEEGGGPCRVPISVADVAAGLAGAEAVLAALFRRERCGKGGRIDVSLFDAILALTGFQAQGTLMTGAAPRALGHRHPNLVPYQVFAASDALFVLAVGTDLQWQRLIALPGMPEGLDRPAWARNAGRVQDRDDLVARLSAAFLRHPLDHWVASFAAQEIPFGRLRRLDAVLADLRRRGDTDGSLAIRLRHESIGELEMLGSPLVFDGRRSVSHRAPPRLDQDGQALLREFAVDDDEFDRWCRDR